MREGHSLAYGARFLKRVIDDNQAADQRALVGGRALSLAPGDGAVQVETVGPRLVAALAYGT